MPRVDPSAAPVAVEDSPTEANGGTTAYRHFVEACAAMDRGELADRRASVPPGGRSRARHGRGADEPRQPRLSPGRARRSAPALRARARSRSDAGRGSLQPRQPARRPRRDRARDRRAAPRLRRRTPSSPTRTTTSASCSRASAARRRPSATSSATSSSTASSDWATHARTLPRYSSRRDVSGRRRRMRGIGQPQRSRA